MEQKTRLVIKEHEAEIIKDEHGQLQIKLLDKGVIVGNDLYLPDLENVKDFVRYSKELAQENRNMMDMKMAFMDVGTKFKIKLKYLI